MAEPQEERPTSNAGAVIKSTIERIEHLNEEIKVLNDDKRDIFAEAKGNGLDVKAIKTIISLRRQDASERQEQEAVVETYMQAMGML